MFMNVASMKLHLPNIITFSRIALSPLFLWLVLAGTPIAVYSAFVVFVIAAITDYMDGYYARRLNVVSRFGNFMDPLADKILTTAAFVGFALQNRVEWWMVWVVIVRDALMTLMRLYGDTVQMPVKTSWSAKVKTTVQMIYIIAILLLGVCEVWIQTPSQTVSLIDVIIELSVYTTGSLHIVYIGMVVVTTITIWTAIEYLYENRLLFVHLLRSVLRS
jgi:CDP-diacylglycerol--glycerol-3-phosphate 3-phosphatidyltransferase